MRKSLFVLAIAAMCVCTWAATGVAIARPAMSRPKTVAPLDPITVPRMLNYQGKLLDSAGLPVADAVYPLQFNLYTLPTGGVAFWTENQMTQTKAGLYSVLLGSVTAIDSFPAAGLCYFGMKVGTDPEMTPRIRIVGAPYAYLAGKANSANYAAQAGATDSARVSAISGNSARLQGKDTTSFVRTGETNCITSAMIIDGTIVTADAASNFKAPYSDTADYARATQDDDSVRIAANAWALQGKDTTGFVRTGQADGISNAMLQNSAVTSAKIENGTILRANVASDFKAPYADTSDYARSAPEVDSTRVAANAWTLQGNDAAYFVHTDQANSVTSAMITNGAIATADAAPDFKAPYSDTADYARVASAVDSTRVAANAYLLDGNAASAFAEVDHAHPFVDSARIAENTYNSEKLQGNDAAYFIHTDQANSVTSGMIGDGTVLRTNVVSDFKAPYSDTADYARSAPAVDSARVAANAYLLDGNAASAFAEVDHAHPFVDSARIAENTYNSEKLQGNDAAYFIHTDQANSVTSGMIGDGTVLRTNVAATFQAPYADTADYARSAPAVDSARVAANAYLLDGNAASAFADVDHAHPFVDSARIAENTYNSEKLQGNDAAYFIHTDQADGISNAMLQNGAVTSAKIQDGTILRTNVASDFKAPYSDTADYARSAPAVDSARVAANAYLLDGNAASTFAVADHAHPFVDSARIAVSTYNSEKLQGNDAAYFIHTGQADGISNAMLQNSSVTSAKIQDGTILRTNVASDFKAPYSDTSDYARSAPEVDSARVAANAYLLDGNAASAFAVADHAHPFVDSARIAADAYLLDGNAASAFAVADHAHPFVDSARIAVSAYNSEKLQGNDAAYFIHTDQANSVTSAMIGDGTVLRTNVAAAFQAPYADTADYARSAPEVDSTRVAANAYLLDGNAASAFAVADHAHPFVDSARIAENTYNSEKLQGNDAAYFIHTDQADGISNAMLQNSSVTSAKIQDGTILRTNVASDFKAPYSDTADYARSAPAVDSARVAANAYLLDGNAASAFADVDHAHPFVDSARIAENTYNSEKLQGNDAAYFIHTDQANSVTSAMIGDGTVLRTNVAAAFQAPYADTADYARSAPEVDSTRVAANAYLLDGNAASAFAVVDHAHSSVDSARVAANAYLLDGNAASAFADVDHAHPFVDSARIAANAYLLDGNAASAFADVDHAHPFVDSARIAENAYNSEKLQGNDAAYFIHTDQANSVTSGMIGDGTVLRTNVASDFKAPYSDTSDYARSAPEVDSARVAANAYLLDGNAASAFADVDHAHPFVDSARIAENAYNSEKLQGNDAAYFIHTDQANSVTSAMIGDGTVLRTNVAAAFQAPYADTADYARALVGGIDGCVIPTSRGPVTLYSQASPESWFEDFGSGTLTTGKTHIDFDALFLETVTISDQCPIKVFLQQTSGSPANLVVVKGSTGFDVVGPGAGDITFDYRVVARRRGFETLRLTPAPSK